MDGAGCAVAVLLRDAVYPPFGWDLEMPVARHQSIFPRHTHPPSQTLVVHFRPHTAPVRQAPDNIRGTLRIPCIWAAAPRRDAAVPAALDGWPIRGTLRGRGHRNCR